MWEVFSKLNSIYNIVQAHSTAGFLPSKGALAILSADYPPPDKMPRSMFADNCLRFFKNKLTYCRQYTIFAAFITDLKLRIC